MKIRKAIFIVIISTLFFSCSKKNKIAPLGYFRIDMPEKNITTMTLKIVIFHLNYQNT